MIPAECKLPNLSNYSTDRLQGMAFLQAFIGDPGIDRREALYRRSFARLVDKALYEYQMARNAVLAQIAEAQRSHEQMASEGRQIFIFSYVDHLENCINAINRALRFFERLKGETLLSGLPRELRRSLEAFSGAVPNVRNTFEHMDEWVRDDKIVDGQPIMLSIGRDGDRAVIGPYEVQFADIARTLRKLHEIGKLMFDNERIRAVTPGGAAVSGMLGEESLGQ